MFSNSRITRRIAQSLVLVTLTTPFLTVCGSSSNEAADDTITFAVVSAESSQFLQSDYDNLVKLIARETGKGIESQNASDYAAVVEGQRVGKIDITSHGPPPYVIAHNSGVPVETVASSTNDESRAPACTPLAYIKEGSNIESLKDLKGKKVCFIDPASTSGYLVPTKGLTDEGLKPDIDLEPVMVGGHDASLLTLNDGGCDAVFAHDAMLETPEKSSQIKPDVLKSIWKSEPITEDLIALNTKTISAEDLAKTETASSDKVNKPALAKEEICSSKEDCTLPEGIERGYLPVTDADFNSIQEICETTKTDACNVVL